MDNEKALGDVVVPLVELLKVLEEERTCDLPTAFENGLICRKQSALLQFSSRWCERFEFDEAIKSLKGSSVSPSWDDIVIASRASLGVIAHIFISAVASKTHGIQIIKPLLARSFFIDQNGVYQEIINDSF